MNWVKLAIDAAKLAYELADEAVRERRRIKAAERWAKTANDVKACPQCREIAYTPKQVSCNKCGALL
jgi:hypothetical protein